MTSDNFFKNNKENFDCIFIHGLHHYDQVIKDINNSLNILNEGGVVLMHDCLPNNLSEQMLPRTRLNWNVDVWKAFVECRTKPNLDCFTCYADWGVGIIFKRSNSKLLEIEQKNFKKLKFHYFYHHYKDLMNIIEFEELLKKF